MRLELLAEPTLAYGQEGCLLVRPYGTEEGSGWGGGEGRFDGERLRGSVRWLNAAPTERRRQQYAMRARAWTGAFTS